MKYNKFDFEQFFNYFLQYGNVHAIFVTPDGYNLGDYERRIRVNWIRLYPHQIDLLTEHGFEWKTPKPNFVVRAYERKNGFDFNKFWAHYLMYGNVIQTFVCPDGYKLGYYEMKIKDSLVSLTDAQKQLLIEHGFSWKHNFHFKYKEFLEYFNQYGNVKKDFVTPDGYRLGYLEYRIRQNELKLADYQKQELNDIGFNWGARRKRRKTNNVDI